MRVLLLLLAVPLVTSDRIVTTNDGPIRGLSVADKNVEAFLSIPYAEPPVGELRFARPVPKSPWRETYHANELPPACIQLKLDKSHITIDTERMSEDCLFLNLWVPEGGSDKKPIMLFIHGGGYMFGSSNWKIYDGAALAEHGDVIVASINYRVGTLGFFSVFIDEAAGNVGMYDQVMAIQWVKDNAKHFRGDPDNIVLFGESAGAFSISLHMISPLSKNLFKRSILQSGTAFHPMYSDNKLQLMGSQAIASMLGCAGDDASLEKNPKAVVDCMKRLPAEEIAQTDQIFFKKIGFLLPRVGDDFLPENPVDLYRKGNFKQDEVLIGVNRDEGSLLISLSNEEIFNKIFNEGEAHSLNESSAKELVSLIGINSVEIFQSYLDRVKHKSRYTYLNAIIDFWGDYLITCGAKYQADSQSMKDVPVYFYLFDYRSPFSTLADWMGVAHFEEVQYIFGNPMYRNEFSSNEEEFSRDIMDMWIAFAKTGNPNIPGGLQWPRYMSEEPKYYILGMKDGVGVSPDNYRCEAWRNYFTASQVVN